MKWSRWVHVSYTVQGLYLLPLRVYRYKKREWHYFLFDLCYFVTILNFVFFWIFPSSPTLFIACYCLSHGSLASAVITWRNSLVFHDHDKVTSLFVHIYPPFSFTVIRYTLLMRPYCQILWIHSGTSTLMQRNDFQRCLQFQTSIQFKLSS